jgi:hypothetical protein
MHYHRDWSLHTADILSRHIRMAPMLSPPEFLVEHVRISHARVAQGDG